MSKRRTWTFTAADVVRHGYTIEAVEITVPVPTQANPNAQIRRLTLQTPEGHEVIFISPGEYQIRIAGLLIHVTSDDPKAP